MYTNQKPQVKWGTHTSPMFEVTNGVKQGGVMSPILYAVYVDGLFHKFVEMWNRLSNEQLFYWMSFICR